MGDLLKTLISIIVLASFIAVGTNYISQQKDKLQLKAIEVKTLSTEVDKLNLKFDDLNKKLKDEKHLNKQQLDKLNKEKLEVEQEKKRLESKLQAKKEAKSKLAKASETVVNRATGTSTASASSGNVHDIIVSATKKYGIDPNYALHIAECESTYTPSSVNYNYWVDKNGKEYGTAGGKYYPSGLFQHVSLYWPARAAKYGYSGASVFDPVANANVTMGMWRDGSKNLWECN